MRCKKQKCKKANPSKYCKLSQTEKGKLGCRIGMIERGQNSDF